MTFGSVEALNIVIRCDALAALGIGHLVRQIALAEELASRGHTVRFRGTTDIDWARAQLSSHGWLLEEPVDGNDPGEIGRGADVVILDGYTYPPSLGRGLQSSGVPVMAMVDDAFGADQVADLYVDQNLGAQKPEGREGRWLVGPQYALLRDVVRSRRGVAAPRDVETPRVLVVFGGSDPFRGAPLAAEMLLETGHPVHAQVIAPDPDVAEAIRGLPTSEGQSVEVLGRSDDLPGLAVACDLAVSAAGSTVWELAALRVPAALIAVVDNQLAGYQAATESLALGLGVLDDLRQDPLARGEAVARLDGLLRSVEARQALASNASRIVDGDGRARVAEAIEAIAH